MAQNCSVESSVAVAGSGGGRRWWRLGTVTLSRSRPQSHTHCRAAESEARWWSNGESMWVFRWFYYPLAFNQLNVQFGGDALMFDIFISISHFKRKLDYKQNIEVKSRNSNSSQCENFQCKLYQIRFYQNIYIFHFWRKMILYFIKIYLLRDFPPFWSLFLRSGSRPVLGGLPTLCCEYLIS